MVEVDSSRHPTRLPREVLCQLNPKLAELYSQLPPALASRVSSLVTGALPQRIRADRVLKFAFLYAKAEQLTQGEAVSKEHMRRSKLELAGEIHGFPTGYRDSVKASQRYRRGRRARQQIKASLDALLVRWRAFDQVVRKHRPELPIHIKSRFSNATLREVGKIFQSMGIVTVLDEEDLTREQGHERERSEIAQAYVWWRLKMAPYRGKWNDMHRLAFAWHMSSAGSASGFRTVVTRISKGAVCIDSFGRSWDSVLSENV